MYCTNCGKEINDKHKYCKNCGAIIEHEEQEKENKIKVEEEKEENTKRISMRYYNFFSKVYLTIITIINMISLVNYQNVHIWDIYVWIQLLLDVILYIVVPIKLINDMHKPTEFTWKILIAFFALDYIYKVIITSLTTYAEYSDTSITTYIIIATGMYGIWFIPNIVYFVKRRNMFKS